MSLFPTVPSQKQATLLTVNQMILVPKIKIKGNIPYHIPKSPSVNLTRKKKENFNINQTSFALEF